MVQIQPKVVLGAQPSELIGASDAVSLQLERVHLKASSAPSTGAARSTSTWIRNCSAVLHMHVVEDVWLNIRKKWYRRALYVSVIY